VNALYRLIFLIFVASSFLFYFGCGSSSSTSRYENSSHDSEPEKTSHRFSSENDADLVSAEDSVNFFGIDDLENSGDLPDDDEVDISTIMERYNSGNETNALETEFSTPKEKMLMEIIRYINTPYKYGGNSKKGIDCSAFTQNVYKSSLSYNLFRSAREQYKQGEIISSMEDLKFGDLVFFDTRKSVKPGHVGIYIGDNLFAHASSKKGVTISSLNHSYYKSRFMGGRRIKSSVNP
jgi:NlpC/P60 family